jgi:aspartyl-tRNA(Asn)/glutamyl-tRNA(Gln) amidotransferase subunit A
MTPVEAVTLAGAAAAVRRGEVSPVDLVERVLARAAETEPDVHAYLTLDAEGARAAAAAAERRVAAGEELGPLHGVPIGVKDLIDTAGLRTTYGSPLFEQHVPSADAVVVARLRRAGAIVVGKHATHELAWGGRTDSAHFGPTHNPHRRDHIAGGSSGGSAASVVVGSALAAVGSDTAGSVRIPAALSGCVGFKPSRDRISLAGVMLLAPSLDHVGTLTRTVADAALLADVIAGPDRDDSRPLPLGGLAVAVPEASTRVAVLGGWFAELLHPAVRGAVETAADTLRAQGMRVVTVDVPVEPLLTDAILTRILFEAGARHRAAFEREPQAFGPDLAALLSLPTPTPAELALAEQMIAASMASLLAVLDEYDVLLTATVPVPAPRLGERSVAFGTQIVEIEHVLTRLTSPFNAAGLPAVSVPAGEADGLPVGVQVVGRPYDDGRALGVAAAIEEGLRC